MKYTNNVSDCNYSTGTRNLRSRPCVSIVHFRQPHLILPSSYFAVAYFSNFFRIIHISGSVIYSAMFLENLIIYDEIAFYAHISRIDLFIFIYYLFIFAYSSHMMWVCIVFGYFIHQRIAMLFPYH